MEFYHYFPGTIPIIVSIPHTGTYVPDFILKRFVSSAKHLPDTDWHLEKLYTFVRELGIHLLIATHSRYVVDLNRPPDGQSLYPGKFTTGLCPTTLFDGTPLYLPGMEPNDQEIQERTQLYWQPYHKKLVSIIDHLQPHKRKILFDAHSICSHVPALFEGTLPHLNVGTADGISADTELTKQLTEYGKSSPYTTVCNGRFKGGYITRHYGQPTKGIHAIQLEMTQLNYMQETYPYSYDDHKAKQLQATLQRFFSKMITWLAH